MLAMRSALFAVVVWLSMSLLFAQGKPYQEGNVDEFLADARSKGRPAIVLFNFSDKSG